MNINNCFSTLGIKYDASVDEVRKAYLELVRTWHPDKYFNKPHLKKKAAEKLKKINNSYEKIIKQFQVISQPAKSLYLVGRKYARLNCSIDVNYYPKSDAFKTYYDLIKNISANGIFIDTKLRLKLEQRLSLTFNLPKFGDFIDITGKVVRNEESGIGVQFVGSKHYQKLLSGLLEIL